MFYDKFHHWDVMCSKEQLKWGNETELAIYICLKTDNCLNIKVIIGHTSIDKPHRHGPRYTCDLKSENKAQVCTVRSPSTSTGPKLEKVVFAAEPLIPGGALPSSCEGARTKGAGGSANGA